MMKFQHNSIYIFFLIFILQKEIIGQVLVDLKNGHCDCEEMLNEFECIIIQKCKFENGKCKSLPCESISVAGCLFAKGQGCILDLKEKTCSTFKGCSSYESKSQLDCSLLPTKCSYDSELKKCVDQTQLPSCSEQLQSECFHGKEGICVFKDGKCQEFTRCEDVQKGDKRCEEASPSCDDYIYDECKHQFGSCEYASKPSCGWVSETINGENYFLCQKGDFQGNKCIDWDPDEQTIDSCLYDSFFTHHWKNDKCEKCQPSNPNSSLQLELVIMLLALTF